MKALTPIVMCVWIGCLCFSGCLSAKKTPTLKDGLNKSTITGNGLHTSPSVPGHSFPFTPIDPATGLPVKVAPPFSSEDYHNRNASGFPTRSYTLGPGDFIDPMIGLCPPEMSGYLYVRRGPFAKPDLLLRPLSGIEMDASKDPNWKRDFDSAHAQAIHGSAKAILKVGFMYYNGIGIKQSDSKALEWYNKAVQKRHGPAYYLMGNLHAYGILVKRDMNKAKEFWAKALDPMKALAQKGEQWAQVKLGKMYANGEGVKKDPILAYAWWNVAMQSRQLLEPSQNTMWALHGKHGLTAVMTVGQITNAKKISKELHRKILINKKEKN